MLRKTKKRRKLVGKMCVIYMLTFLCIIVYLITPVFADNATFSQDDITDDHSSVKTKEKIESSDAEDNNSAIKEISIDKYDDTLIEQKKIEKKVNSDIDYTSNTNVETASGICGTSAWRISSDGTLYIGEGEFPLVDKTQLFPWFTYRNSVFKVVFEGKVTASSNINYLFYFMSKVESIENLSYLDTSNSETMISMFSQMTSLKNLDITSLNTSKVKDMSAMFSGMASLNTLDVSNFDTSNVTDMSHMFSGCSMLDTLDLSSFNTSNVTNMYRMFYNMSSLKNLDLSNFDLSNVIKMDGIFYKTSSLFQLTLGNKFKFVGDNKIIQIPKIDATTPFGYTGKWVNVGDGTVDTPLGQKQWTSDELVDNYKETDADTFVWEKFGELEVETKNAEVLLGSNLSSIDYKEFIKSVKLGNRELNNNDYTVELEKDFSTSIIGDKQLKLTVKVMLPDTGGQFKEVSVDATTSIIWGSTLVIKDNGLGRVDASVSLLRKDGSPYLNANQGSGFSGSTLTSRPEISVYQNSEAEKVLTAHYETVGNTPSVLAGKWNTIFQDNAVKYGNVLRIYVNKWNGGANWKGNNTFISRNNSLITETVGYDYAYYELTPSGYHLLRVNQLVVNNNLKVKLNTSKEEMNKNISNFISLPEHIENPNDFRMEFESVDTTSSGNKKSTINVYETLESGGEFKTTYEVTYTVNPEVTEFYYDINGKQIEQSQITEFNYGQEFTPNPEEYIENNGDLYIYRGWVDTLPGTENIVPQEGVPEATKVEKNYYYIYDKADKFINVTLPTEVVFGTFENNNKISSKAYEIKNNSDELPIEVSLERFDKVTSDIKLLSSNAPDPTQEEASAKLNLCVDKESVIPGLTEDTPRQTITKIDTNTSRAISLEGTYFGNMSDKNILDYKMHLKFKATQDNKN